jgi:DNA-damage-inducible protein J
MRKEESKSEMIRARIEPSVKRSAERVLKTLGLSATEAISMFYRQIAIQRGLPFAVRIPNAETIKAINDGKQRKGTKTFVNIQELMREYE